MSNQIAQFIVLLLTVISGFAAISYFYKALSKHTDPTEKKRDLTLAIIALVFSIPLFYLLLGKTQTPTLTDCAIDKNKPIDIGGFYQGFLYNDLAQKVTTFLSIEHDKKTDSLIMTFRNDQIRSLLVKYDFATNSIHSSEIGTMNVVLKDCYVLIKPASKTNQPWEFKKDSSAY